MIQTIRGLAKDGEIEAAQREFIISGGMFANVQSIHKALSNSGRTVRLIDRNPTISADEKRQSIDAIYEQMTQMAQAGNKMLARARKMQCFYCGFVFGCWEGMLGRNRGSGPVFSDVFRVLRRSGGLLLPGGPYPLRRRNPATLAVIMLSGMALPC